MASSTGVDVSENVPPCFRVWNREIDGVSLSDVS